MLCVSCPIKDHSDQKRIGVNEKLENSEYFDEKEEEVRKVQEELDTLIHTFMKSKDKLTESEEDIMKTIDERVDSVLQEAEKLKKMVKEKVKKEMDEITDKEEQAYNCRKEGIKTMTDMKKNRAGYLGAFQMHVAQRKLEEFTKFTEDARKLDTSFEVPVVSAEHDTTVGRLTTRTLQPDLDLDLRSGDATGTQERAAHARENEGWWRRFWRKRDDDAGSGDGSTRQRKDEGYWHK